MGSVVKSPRARTVLLIFAGCLLLGALVWSLLLTGDDELARIAGEVNAFGYSLTGEDLFVAGNDADSSIRALLAGQDLTEAVEASRAAGFPADVDTAGDVVLMLAELADGEVVTLYLKDGAIQLGFIQRRNTGEVRSLLQGEVQP